MDRDMVNCMHHLYHLGKLTDKQMNKLFWCGPDTAHPLVTMQIVLRDALGTNISLAPGVFNLLKAVDEQLASLPKPDYAFGYPIAAPPRAPGKKRPAFLAISYDKAFMPVRRAVLKAAGLAGFKCEVTKDLQTPGVITNHVWQGIRAADVVVADITGDNPNVFYEIGLAHALGKDVIIISQTSAAPFDIRAHRKMGYDPNDLNDLTARLVPVFKAVPARYKYEGARHRF